ncbi:hypothetical protein [Ideonella sp.]|uniref:hypothetical protein n=1 Tax=Ideonella sp. TaxID=1929293 RepID=UPI0035ADE2D6
MKQLSITLAAACTALSLSLSLSLCLPARAHGDAKPMHGGIVQTAADLQYELVPQPQGAALYVVDHGQPADATRLGGKLTVLNGTARSEAPLKPAGGNKLEATGITVGPGAKVVASVQGADGRTTSVRFTVR